MAVEITPDYMIIGGKKVDMRPPYTTGVTASQLERFGIK